uniref:Ferroptosis suppressor protein 1 n=1 Tax=Laticauda laticaudata TaxID=8630 RepID=A0A8C5RUC9_LATLA
MGSKVSVDDSVHVVIVGGGFGGMEAARLLQDWGIPFILVDMRDSFHHNVAALRASVLSGFAKKTFISFSETFKDSFQQGKVVEIDLEKHQVLLNDGKVSACKIKCVTSERLHNFCNNYNFILIFFLRCFHFLI